MQNRIRLLILAAVVVGRLKTVKNDMGNDPYVIDLLVEPTLHFEVGVNANCLSLSPKKRLVHF